MRDIDLYFHKIITIYNLMRDIDLFFHKMIMVQNLVLHSKFLYLGWTGREKEISPLEAFLYICSKKHGWLGSVRPEVFWEGPSLQDFVERDI